MEVVLFVFLATWVIGTAVTVGIFRATSAQPWAVRTSLRALALAVTFTPSILAVGHGAAPMPAIVVLLSYLNPRYSGAGPFVAGALPIVIVWAVLVLIWSVLVHILEANRGGR
jgi:hypothetical protein